MDSVSRLFTVSMASILPVSGQKLEQFSLDVMLSLGTTNPAIIHDPDQKLMWPWSSHLSATLVAAPNDPNDAKISIDQLNNLISLDEIDFILFTTPIASQLITVMANELGTHNPKIAMLMPHGYPVSFPLRLDSRLFIYKISGGSATLFEKYYIR